MFGKFFVDDTTNNTFRLTITKFGFGLSLKLRLGYLYTHNGRESFTEVLTREVGIFFEHVVRRRIGVQRTSKGTAETRDVCATFNGVDVVDVTQQGFGEAAVVLKTYFNLRFNVRLVYGRSLHEDGLGDCRSV